MSSSVIKTFEEQFNVFVPHEQQIVTDPKRELIEHKHDDAGILVKAIAYFIDIGICIFIIPIIYNTYHYIKRWQTLGQRMMGIRIYDYYFIGRIPRIGQLIIRFMVKFWFLLSWTIIGMNLVALALDGYPYGNQVSVTYEMLYTGVMVLWIHGYIYTMWVNKHRRWIQDIIAGTIVAYDTWYKVKRVLMGIMVCAVLYYAIFWLSPSILELIDIHIQGERAVRYSSAWDWIDYWVLTGAHVLSNRIGL